MRAMEKVESEEPFHFSTAPVRQSATKPDATDPREFAALSLLFMFDLDGFFDCLQNPIWGYFNFPSVDLNFPNPRLHQLA
jgi:hypothetical protein